VCPMIVVVFVVLGPLIVLSQHIRFSSKLYMYRMGYTAATGGNILEAEPLILGSTLFLWQFPHFFALNWMYREDYKRGGFAMIATSDPDGSRTASLIRQYTLYLASIPIVSSVLEITSPMFAVEGLVLNSYAFYVAHKFDRDRSNANARKVFLTSLWYLPCIMMLFLLHSRQWHKENATDDLEEEARASSPLENLMHYLQSKGKELCIHETIADKDVWISLNEKKTPFDKSKCPVSLVRNMKDEDVEKDDETAADCRKV